MIDRTCIASPGRPAILRTRCHYIEANLFIVGLAVATFLVPPSVAAPPESQPATSRPAIVASRPTMPPRPMPPRHHLVTSRPPAYTRPNSRAASRPEGIARPPFAPASRPAVVTSRPFPAATHPAPASMMAPTAAPPVTSRPSSSTASSRPGVLPKPATSITPPPPPPPPEPLAVTTTGPAPASQPVFKRPDDKPDILLITASNLPLTMTGFGGNKIVKTPNLDRLAADGTLFTRFYTPTPQAAPARASLLTGLYPHRHGVTNDGTQLYPRTEVFTERLAQAGYRCAVVGPWNFAGVATTRPTFGFADYPATTSQPWSWKDCDVWVNGHHGKANKFLTDWITDWAVDYLARGGDQPSFLWVSFQAPGEPTIYPPGDEKLYPPASVDLPPTFKSPVTDPPIAINSMPMARAFQGAGESKLRDARSKYYAMLTHLDTQVGRLLNDLDRLGLRKRTIVVFTSEMGVALGDHQLMGVGPAFYDEMIRCPLVVSAPGAVGRNVKVDRIVSLVDVAPTLLQFAGIATPIAMQGQSLTPLMADPASQAVADECFLEYERQDNLTCHVRGLVVRNFKFTDYSTGNDALYDLGRDAEETHNVAQQVEYKPVTDVLTKRLQQWQRLTRDPSYRK